MKSNSTIKNRRSFRILFLFILATSKKNFFETNLNIYFIDVFVLKLENYFFNTHKMST